MPRHSNFTADHLDSNDVPPKVIAILNKQTSKGIAPNNLDRAIEEALGRKLIQQATAKCRGKWQGV